MQAEGGARILVTVTGPDHPGITAALTAILARNHTEILDMEQVVVQGRLSLGILFAGDRAGSTSVLQELLFAAKEHGNDLDFRLLEPSSTRAPHTPYVLTLLGEPALQASTVAAVSAVLARHSINIEKIQRLSEDRFATLEMTIDVPDEAVARNVRAALVREAAALDVDVALQAEGLFRRAKRLVVFDLDSTLVRGEWSDRLGEQIDRQHVGLAAITRRAMNAEIDYATAVRERVAMLAGLPVAALQELGEAAELMPGAAELIAVLRRLGYKIGILSGGFAQAAEAVRRRLDLDWAHGNQVEVVEGRLTGRVLEPILDAEAKANLVRDHAEASGISLDQVIAVGNGANDLPMLEIAGLGIAFNAYDAVRHRAQHVLNRPRLDSILFLLGLPEKEIRAIHATAAVIKG